MSGESNGTGEIAWDQGRAKEGSTGCVIAEQDYVKTREGGERKQGGVEKGGGGRRGGLLLDKVRRWEWPHSLCTKHGQERTGRTPLLLFMSFLY